jgi:signal transduction histidine kinase
MDETTRFSEQLAAGIKKSQLSAYVEAATQSAQIMLANLRQASRLTDSFKNVAVGASQTGKERFRLRAHLDELSLSLALPVREAGHQLVVDCATDCEVESFPGELTQVVSNLVLNACHHAFEAPTKGTIRVEARARPDGAIDLAVRDDGKGIAPENMAKIYDPFFTTKRGSGRSGLGLNIVYNIVTQKLRGTIACDSSLGAGTTVNIQFPAN